MATWNKTRKRNQWGIHKQAARSAADWLELPAPSLAIVPADLWAAAHTRLASARAIYFTATAGQAFGRPALGGPAKYLLTNLALCGCCGGPLKVLSRTHGTGRKHFYGCAWHHDRGQRACANGKDVPMSDANDIVIEALLDDVLDDSMLIEAVDEAVRLLQGEPSENRAGALERELATVEQERNRLVAAIAEGGQLDGLLSALQARETRRATLEAQREQMRAERH